MPPSDSNPQSEFELVDRFADELASEPADERVYRTALQLYEATRVAEVAERADCAPDTARRHLERLVDIGVLEQVADDPATYKRNDSYFEWRKRNRLEQLSTQQLQEQLETLTRREQEFQDEYDANHPSDVDALDHAGYENVEDVWMDLSEWEAVRRRIQRLEDIRQQRAATSDSSESGKA